jgi:carbon storage regulator
MLVLTRKVGERIRIGDEVTLQVLEVRGGQVRLGLAAPADVRIYREEIFLAIEGQNQDAQLPDHPLADAAAVWKRMANVAEKQRRGAAPTRGDPRPVGRFGDLRFPSTVCCTPQGLIGFPRARRYVILDHRPGSPFAGCCA